MFEERDANKDGKLSADEMPEQMKGRLEQIDTDKDGSVSREEMEAMMSRMRWTGIGLQYTVYEMIDDTSYDWRNS